MELFSEMVLDPDHFLKKREVVLVLGKNIIEPILVVSAGDNFRPIFFDDIP